MEYSLPTKSRRANIRRCLFNGYMIMSSFHKSFDIFYDLATSDLNILHILYNMKIEDQNSWSILCQLQRQLKKQFLLVQKQQQEKIKLKREIQESIRNYHALSIEIREPKAEILKDEGFDVIVGISSQIELGRQIVFLAQEQSSLIHLVIQSFYENVETNDFSQKDAIRLMHRLMGQLFLPEPQTPSAHKHRIVQAWKYYMHKVDHEHYFEQISNSTLKQLLKEEKKPNRNSYNSDKDIQDENEGCEYSWQVKNKEQLVQEFIEVVQKQAQMVPPSIKVPLRAAYESAASNEEARTSRIWQLLSSFYLKPFKVASAHHSLPVHLRQRILNFIDDLISRCRFVSELSHENIGQSKIKGSPHYASIQRVCNSVVEVNQDTYKQTFLKVKQASANHGIQIKIIGACLNMQQLQELLILLNGHKEAFGKVSQRIVHRTQRIFEMSPNLQILRRQRAAFQYVSLAQLHYEQSISSDYYKIYSNTYRSQTLKQILKQVLVELQGLGDYRTSQHCGFTQIFNSIVQRNMENISKNALSAQLEMKVKYLIYLLGGKEKNQAQVMRQMMQELKSRNSINVKLFEDTKFSLLKVYCNLRNLKLQLRGRQDGQRRGKVKFQLLDKLQDFRLDLCVTSRSSRNKAQGEQIVDQYRYRMSSADDILVAPINACIHKDNPFTGSHCHASTVAKFLKIFTSLPEVRYFVGNPSFLAPQNSSYKYCSENKIRAAFSQFVREVIERLKLAEEERGMLESILYRRLVQLLLGKVDSPYTFPKDRQLLGQIQSKNDVPREPDSPRKRNESPIKRNQALNSRKRRGSASFDDSPLKMQKVSSKKEINDSIQLDQLVEIGARHICTMSLGNSPLQKVRKLKEMLEIYRMVIDKSDPKAADIIQQLVHSSITTARHPNLISTISFLQIFLPEDKLMSSEGMVLKQFQRVIRKILEGADSGRRLDRSRINDC